VTSSAALEKAASELAAQPSPEALVVCRERWCSALLDWKRLYCFRSGPFVETSALYRAAFWPLRAQGLARTLSGTAPIDDLSLDRLGVDQKGLYALEYLLFGAEGGQDVLPLLSGPSNARPRELVVAAARGVNKLARLGADKLGDGKGYAVAFAAGGQDNLNRVVNQMLETVESNYEHLARVLGLAASGMLRSVEVEGWPSGQSHQIARTIFDQTGRLYARPGRPGLSELVRAKSAPMDDHLRAALAKMQEAAAALDAPLEQLVRRDRARLEAAAKAAKALEVALKVDLASALGVTLTFTSGDGD
jgi:predicted lipoprotein